MPARTQDDLVKEEQMFEPQEETRRLRLPGIEVLHQRPYEEVAEVLANVIRSEREVVRMTWEIGKHIDLVVRK